MIAAPSAPKMRLDKWLWAARFYKTRSLATAAVDHHRVLVNHQKAKPARLLAVGDALTIRRGPFEQQIVVCQLSAQRGPAPQAAQLYYETPESCAKRAALAVQLQALPRPASRPTKKARRQIIQFTRRTGADDESPGRG